MAILPAQTIRALCLSPKAIVHPFHERTQHAGMTFGLSAAGYDVRIAEDMVVISGTFRLASTLENFWMPDDLIARVCDKSTWARQGLTVQNTIIEPGWRGYLTIELTNHSSRDVILKSGMPIAQIVFERLEAPTEQPYVGKYQDQQQGPQPAILSMPPSATATAA